MIRAPICLRLHLQENTHVVFDINKLFVLRTQNAEIHMEKYTEYINIYFF